MQFENQNDETFFIKFADVLRIERDPKSENGILITLNRYLDSHFVVKSSDRKRLMNEIKKYWKTFIDEKKEKMLNKDQREGSQADGYFESIKKIIFKT